MHFGYIIDQLQKAIYSILFFINQANYLISFRILSQPASGILAPIT